MKLYVVQDIIFEQLVIHVGVIDSKDYVYVMSRTCLNIRIRACCLLSTWGDFPWQRAGVIVPCGDPLSSPVWLRQLNTAAQTRSFTHPQLRVTRWRPVIISCVCASECVSAERPPVGPNVWLTLNEEALLSRVLAGICTNRFTAVPWSKIFASSQWSFCIFL